jgi:hypothetical protein
VVEKREVFLKKERRMQKTGPEKAHYRNKPCD